MIQVNLTAIVLKHDLGVDFELWSGGTTRVDQFFFKKNQINLVLTKQISKKSQWFFESCFIPSKLNFLIESSQINLPLFFIKPDRSACQVRLYFITRAIINIINFNTQYKLK